MPRQETFLRENVNGVAIEVLKTYDRSYAREVFGRMSDEAEEALAEALEIEESYERADIPEHGGNDYEDFLWEELCKAAREDVRQDPNLYSFFVVSESKGGRSEDLYISPDWPSAEEFAKKRISLLDPDVADNG